MRRRKILVVDDDEQIVDFLKQRLEYHHYEVLTAFNGKEAIRVFGAKSPDLILLDIKMPQMDGLKVLETIRKEETSKGFSLGKGVPVIMLTGYPGIDGSRLYCKRMFGQCDLCRRCVGVQRANRSSPSVRFKTCPGESPNESKKIIGERYLSIHKELSRILPSVGVVGS
ncbi:MAG: response regulator [Candidatus Omnitrophica bacterium]|nr:response regulator [Candidatus Omnitrophota bacterium]MDD5671022.1 response regulator [Candidatus Omnitrophota bacterium]